MHEGRKAITRRQALALSLSAGAAVLAAPVSAAIRLGRQDQAPGLRDIAIQARNYSFSPDRIEVFKDDRVRLTITGADQVHSFTLDEYRIARRIAPGTTTVVDFRADRAGTFAYFCNIGTDPGCKGMRGTLVVVGK